MNREEILKRISKSEDKLVVAKVLDKLLLSEKTNKLAITDFLDPHLQSVVSKCLESNNVGNYLFYGGYDGAERAVVAFCPSNMPLIQEPELAGLFKVLKISLMHRENMTHRDYLGSLMGLGIKREKIGDILVKDEHSLVVALNDIADFIRHNLDKVGNVKVEVEYLDVESLNTYEQKVKEIRTTVASLRLDSVASAGFGMSRSKIADFIKAEKVNLNWETTPSLTKLVKEGDLISIRGKGRVVLQEIGKTTRKDRISVCLKKFI
ncbi:YlmH family RNA-binding protein [Acetivibrio cellulolyticus]|uniref:YlmH family RNA-binding protein n=1 Tax=Acetivibrio cellulolyticus TaxID=35830 RepID=UPI0001E2D0F5|nr:YlmH/Sll1252 family protein [Acetivibrio cellulolyticus]